MKLFLLALRKIDQRYFVYSVYFSSIAMQGLFTGLIQNFFLINTLEKSMTNSRADGLIFLSSLSGILFRAEISILYSKNIM